MKIKKEIDNGIIHYYELDQHENYFENLRMEDREFNDSIYNIDPDFSIYYEE